VDPLKKIKLGADVGLDLVKKLFAKPLKRDALGEIIPKTPSKAKQFFDTRVNNARDITKITVPLLGAAGLGTGIYKLATQPDPTVSPTDIRFMTPTETIDKNLQKQQELINQAYAPDTASYDRLAQMYAALDMSGRDAYSNLSNELSTGMNTMATPADASAVNQYYAKAAAEADAMNAAPTGNIQSGIVPTSGDNAVMPGQIRDAGTVMSQYLKNQAYMDAANRDASISDINRFGQGYSQNLASELQGMLFNADLKNNAAKKDALAQLAMNAGLEKMNAATTLPVIPTQTDINSILNKGWKKLNTSQKQQTLASIIPAATLTELRKTMSDDQIYVNAMLGRI